jgi:hypothetical protein
MKDMVLERTKLLVNCDIAKNCINLNGQNVLTTNVNLIHFFYIRNCKN